LSLAEFIFDMQGVEAIYRVLSFIGLGLLLLAGSLLYHRYFRNGREHAA
jgi:uncharacterized membrane protein